MPKHTRKAKTVTKPTTTPVAGTSLESLPLASAMRLLDPAFRARKALDRRALARVCAMAEEAFVSHYDMTRVRVPQRWPDNFYAFKDNGADVLAVAHLDTVSHPEGRKAHFVDTEAGPVIFSRALDDRLGAYVILELLPQLGVEADWLLTVGEESGRSTAQFFEPEKEYNWVFEFDRGGCDVVSYQFEDDDLNARIRRTGAKVGDGIFSDICYLDHLGRKAVNWGVGYRDYHTARSHAFLDDTTDMVGRFLRFYEDNADTVLLHTDERDSWWSMGYSGYGSSVLGDNLDDELECDRIFGPHDHNDDDCEKALEDMGVLQQRD